MTALLPSLKTKIVATIVTIVIIAKIERSDAQDFIVVREH